MKTQTIHVQRGNGRILVVDEDETFSKSVSTLLQERGYASFFARDAGSAIQMLETMPFDLLIISIRMAIRPELKETVKRELSVILISECSSPGMDDQDLQLPSVSHITKPLDPDQILCQVEQVIGNSDQPHSMDPDPIPERLKEPEPSALHQPNGSGARSFPHASEAPLGIEAFLDLNYQTILGALSNVIHLANASSKQPEARPPCRLFNCPRLSVMKQALIETIEVINRTKGTFKSKDLGDLRKKLEGFVKTCE